MRLRRALSVIARPVEDAIAHDPPERSSHDPRRGRHQRKQGGAGELDADSCGAATTGIQLSVKKPERPAVTEIGYRQSPSPSAWRGGGRHRRSALCAAVVLRKRCKLLGRDRLIAGLSRTFPTKSTALSRRKAHLGSDLGDERPAPGDQHDQPCDERRRKRVAQPRARMRDPLRKAAFEPVRVGLGRSRWGRPTRLPSDPAQRQHSPQARFRAPCRRFRRTGPDRR